MNLITGELKPNFRNILITGEDVTEHQIYIRTKKFKISFVPKLDGQYADITTEDNLNDIGEIVIRDTQQIKQKIKKEKRANAEGIINKGKKMEISSVDFKKKLMNAD